MENPVDFDDLVNDAENDETDSVGLVTRLVDEWTERPNSDSKLNTEVFKCVCVRYKQLNKLRN